MLIRGDARHLPLADACVDCVVTSPPYFGLRDYGSCTQIGLESTVTGYVDAICSVFREVRRVLKPSGTVWLNLGDSYAGSWSGTSVRPEGGQQRSGVPGFQSKAAAEGQYAKRKGETHGMKAKDLMMIPARAALALQADGWYLRSDIIWSKPNPMPESVTDRPTKAHEYLFLLSKQEKYYYDAAAIAEPVSLSMLQQVDEGYDGLGLKDYEAAGVQNPSTVKARIIEGARTKLQNLQAQGARQDGDRIKNQPNGRCLTGAITRHRRSVWTVATMPYAGAHFATMPEKLVEPCILAGCPLGGLVLDPFCGTFTVGAVAARLGRRAVGVDLRYQDLAKERTAQRGLSFSQVPA